MKHRHKHSSTFGLKRGPRKALLRGLVASLVEHERIKTTLPRARAVRPLVEKAVTMARKGGVHSQRLILAKYPNKKTVSKLMGDLSKRFKERAGGYTRIIKLGLRPGDQAEKALIEFVDYQFKPAPTPEEKAKYKASVEYKKSRRALEKKNEIKRKSRRQMQQSSRRLNRSAK